MPHPSSWIRKAKRLRIYARDSFTCVYCNHQCDRLHLTLDHINGRTSNHHTKLVTACRSCNSSKGNKTLRQWRGAHPAYPYIKRRICNAVRRRLP